MKFQDMYPNAVHLQEFRYNGDSVIKSSEIEAPCFQCDNSTSFISLAFEAPICSEECLDSLWQDYAEALKKKH